MTKRIFLTVILLFPMVFQTVSTSDLRAYDRNTSFGLSQNSDFSQKFKDLSISELYQTAHRYDTNKHFDTALFVYNLLIHTPVQDTEHLYIVKALNNAAVIYLRLSHFRNAYDFLIRALLLSESIQSSPHEEAKIYNNLGSVYKYFDQDDIARLHYLRSLDLFEDSVVMVLVLSNVGETEFKLGNLDSAEYYINKALQLSRRQNNAHSQTILKLKALFCQSNQRYDSAFHYYGLALAEAKKVNDREKEAQILANLGHLFFETKKIDSALFYLNLSNTLAKEHDFLAIVESNYLILSDIEFSRGHHKNAFQHLQQHLALKELVYGVDIFGEINQIQHLYEVSKINQQIERLVIEQQVKQKTIHFQRIVQLILLVVLLLVIAALVFFFFQNRRLNRAYHTLFEKNMELIEFHNKTDNPLEKYKNRSLTDDTQKELLEQILAIMEDTAIICDTEFSINKLAKLVQSNEAYVSQTINTAFQKNFRSFLNRYRIREAQRLISELDTSKYTLELVGQQVGFKSQSAFRNVFKEITGITPHFYLKSVQG